MTDRRPARKLHVASSARILTTGITVAAGIGLVGSMALAARANNVPPPSPAAVVRQIVIPRDQTQTVIVVQRTPSHPTVDVPAMPQPVVDMVPAPAATQSQGS